MTPEGRNWLRFLVIMVCVMCLVGIVIEHFWIVVAIILWQIVKATAGCFEPEDE